jgi:hypothetical protein
VKLETALKQPHTVQQLMKLTGLSRGGVLNKLKKLAKKAGKSETGNRGPPSILYVLRGKKTRTRRARAPEAAVPGSESQGALSNANAASGNFPEQALNVVETTPPTYEALPEIA